MQIKKKIELLLACDGQGAAQALKRLTVSPCNGLQHIMKDPDTDGQYLVGIEAVLDGAVRYNERRGVRNGLTAGTWTGQLKCPNSYKH